MPLPQEELLELQGEGARHWNDLRAIWSELAPGPEAGTPKFRSRDLNPQQAGLVFEWWILEGFRLSHIGGHRPFRVSLDGSMTLEQVDGIILEGWAGFLIESKFQAAGVDVDPIYRLHFLVERRPIGTLGLFFSASGYTRPALETSRFLTPMRVLLFDAADLHWAMQRPAGMREMVRRKWTLALKAGRSYTAVTESMDLFPGSTRDDHHERPDDRGEPPGPALSGSDLPRRD